MSEFVDSSTHHHQQQQLSLIPSVEAILELCGISGGIAVKRFQNLNGRVVFFRPKVGRQASKGYYVERVLFVQSNGTAHITDNMGTPKRSFPLSSCTSVMTGKSGSNDDIVVLLFEQSAEEHDLKLRFEACSSGPTGPSDSFSARLPSIKSFVSVVQHFAPKVEHTKSLTSDELRSVSMRLAKPKSFHHPHRVAVLGERGSPTAERRDSSPSEAASFNNRYLAMMEAGAMSAVGTDDRHSDCFDDEDLTNGTELAATATFRDLYGDDGFAELDRILEPESQKLHPEDHSTVEEASPASVADGRREDSDSGDRDPYSPVSLKDTLSFPNDTNTSAAIASLQLQSKNEMARLSLLNVPPAGQGRIIADPAGSVSSSSSKSWTSENGFSPMTAPHSGTNRQFQQEPDAFGPGRGGNPPHRDDSALRPQLSLQLDTVDFGETVLSADYQFPPPQEGATCTPSTTHGDDDDDHQDQQEVRVEDPVTAKTRKQIEALRRRNHFLELQLQAVEGEIEQLGGVAQLPTLQREKLLQEQAIDQWSCDPQHEGLPPPVAKRMYATVGYQRAVNLSLIVSSICQRAKLDQRGKWGAPNQRHHGNLAVQGGASQAGSHLFAPRVSPSHKPPATPRLYH